MTKPTVTIIGAGLCGSVLAARLRNAFDVTVIEQAQKPKPLYDDIQCPTGGVTSTINRAAGLGGTTNYWHNALIELAPDELQGCGIDPGQFAPYYRRAWSLFLTDEQLLACQKIREQTSTAIVGSGTAHMVVPQARVNLWDLANTTWPGDPVNIIYGRATRVSADSAGGARQVHVETARGEQGVAADHVIVCAGGLATPALLAASFRTGETLCGGYHDHPMAYVAKIRLRTESALKRISCVETGPASVRAGFVYESRGLKAVFYLRPALNLNTRSITGDARYILSDLRNDPFSPRKILQLLTNVEAIREAVLFKTRTGFVGDYYSVLMLGEQESLDTRGVRCASGRIPVLNWHVTDTEHLAYQECFAQFLAEIAGDTVEHNAIPASKWEYRTAAHHSGTARDFTSNASGDLDFYAIKDERNVFVCDGSILRRGGVANSGLTLVALCHRLADAMIAG